MELDTQLLLIYFALWGIFYFYLVKVIADRSVQKWIDRFDQDVTPEGGELLVHLLKPVLEEIFTDNEQLLKDFKTSFFATVAPQVREAKRIVETLNPAGTALKELTKDNPLLSLILSHIDLPNIIKTSTNSDETSTNIGISSKNIDEYGL
jgi:hypothetical protein